MATPSVGNTNRCLIWRHVSWVHASRKPTLTESRFLAMSASISAIRGQAFSDYPPLPCRCHSGLVLLFGIGTKALPVWDSRTRWNNLLGGLAVRGTAGPSGQANSPHPPSCEGHLSTARWSSGFSYRIWSFTALMLPLLLGSSDSVPSTHMRCMMTASRRAKATIAFFIPRCLAIFTAQALSQDHLVGSALTCPEPLHRA